MAVILVLCILVLGYHHIEKVPLEKAKLKRGNNWEAYVILAKHGLFHLSLGLYAVLSISALLLIATLLGSWLFGQLGFDVNAKKILEILLRTIDNPVFMPWILLPISMLGGLASSQYFVEKYNLNKLSNLKNQDGFFGYRLRGYRKKYPYKNILKIQKGLCGGGL